MHTNGYTHTFTSQYGWWDLRSIWLYGYTLSFRTKYCCRLKMHIHKCVADMLIIITCCARNSATSGWLLATAMCSGEYPSSFWRLRYWGKRATNCSTALQIHMHINSKFIHHPNAHNPLWTWFWGAMYILNVITKTHSVRYILMFNTYGSSPNPQASWMQLEHLKLTREGSAPASRRMDTDLFLWATMAHCSAVLPFLSYSCWKK